MDNSIRASLTTPFLAEICQRYRLAPVDLTLLGCWQNFVYRFDRDGRGYILRVTHRSHRSPAMVQSELDFVTYLAEHGVNAARPAGPVETVGDFAAAVFEQVPGVNPFSAVDMWQVCREIGRLTGRMHRLARQYRPSPGVQPRFAWHENDYLRDLDRYVPSEQVGVRRTFRRLMEQLHALPKDADSYGLIHGDVVVGNYLWHAGQLHIFDFDEAHYGWFASDVAIPLFYAIPFPSEDREEMATGFLREFFAGYNQEFRLDPFWLKQLPLFLRLRQMILYTTLYRNGDLEKLSPWGQRFMAFARTNLETDEPFMAFDFGRETPVL